MMARMARNAYIIYLAGLFAFACTTPLSREFASSSPFTRMCAPTYARKCAINAVAFVLTWNAGAIWSDSADLEIILLKEDPLRSFSPLTPSPLTLFSTAGG